MSDEATWTEKFDRWWAERGLHPMGDSFTIREQARDAFMAGAAAERAEHEYSSDTECEQRGLRPCPDCGKLVPPGDFHVGCHGQSNPQVRYVEIQPAGVDPSPLGALDDWDI